MGLAAGLRAGDSAAELGASPEPSSSESELLEELELSALLTGGGGSAAPVAYLMVSFWVSGNLGGVRHKDAFSIYLPVRVADLNIAGDAGGDRSAERPGRESVWFVPQVAS